MIVSFVILNYLSYNDTIECVDSIIDNVLFKNKKIVIVDNGSNNESFDVLQEKFKDDKYKSIVYLIRSDENIGFAKGNNMGYMYAKDRLKSDFIVVINNDTIITQNNFVDVIINKWNRYKYYILGPDIVTSDGFHQNPMKSKNWTLPKLYLFYIKNCIRLIDAYLLSFENIILKLKKQTSKNKMVSEDLLNVKLHGACLIFSPEYINKFNGFYKKTFLYMEEDILEMEMKHYKYKTLYSGDLTIYHKEDVSTNMLKRNKRDKQIFFLKNLICSNRICIYRFKELKNEGEM